ncbi:DUF4391 domain-containing protein [Riemerella anatipestifer]|uniref:DUF4391 domain-containing protein n=1 Tax=Riemerella anatipestifer RA-CH-1 TaxID=1228997 RepID=J9RA50_RIEAN|nr:DUF4391 domain-containing protein [Riemerella anatipestifer]AFR36587.1 hypothetical protein B739_2005 [Riemerella anatipestifer RA-CH-1]AIH01382.1 hypothetical protein M949_0211 [Riemerella anatipestifer CH3]MCO7331380.1 DUF4391 domain-containing protein [Riemerella anatipestifer]MCO7350149.1 DUF4391 domain-containing protein [Riemerella anatipestifer]MCU7582175.1 DUF4391 domain-containing protein [Riemerella anatipestifer]
MAFFNLPITTEVNRVIPKNAFDDYTNTKQKKLFTDYIYKITWTHKISENTVNLIAKNIQEIQVFRIELKQKVNISKILEIINKSIPYHIVFWIEYDDEAYISTASKHSHPTDENFSVIDWTFTSEWFDISDIPFQFNLKKSLDDVFKNLCIQLSGKDNIDSQPINRIIKNQQEEAYLKREISKIKSAISKSKQFNEKVELNLALKEMEKKLNALN